MPSDNLSSEAGKTARGGTFLFFGNALSTVLLAVGSIIIARLLGPSGYGLYAVTLVTPLILVGLADAGMQFVLVRAPAKFISEGDYGGAYHAIKIGFTIKVCTSAVASLICYVGADPIALFILNRPDLASLLRLASLLIVSQALLDSAARAFVGLDLMDYSAGIQVLYSLVKSVLSPLLIVLGFGLVGAISGYVLGVCIPGCIGAIILVAKRNTRPVAETDEPYSGMWGDLLRYALPLYAATLLITFLTQYQNIVLAHFASNVEIGNFNAALNFNVLLVVLTYPITVALFPMFSKMDPVSRRDDLVKGFELSTRYTCLLVLPCAVAFMLFSRDLLFLTYGKAYVLAPWYLILFSSLWFLAGLGTGGLGSGGTLGSFLLGVGDTRTIFIMNFLILAIFIPLGPVLAWGWGVYGLLVAVIIANTIPNIYGLYGASLRIGTSFNLRGNLPILIAAVASGLPIIALLPLHLAGAGLRSTLLDFIGGGLIYLFVYLTLLPILRAISRIDVENLKMIFENMPIIRTLAKPIFAYEIRILSRLAGPD